MDYPLPWNAALDEPYWQTNFRWCLTREGWREWQSRKSMKGIIPVIDWVQSSTSR